MGTRRYVRVLLATLLVFVPALIGVLAGAIASSEAAGLPGAQAAHGSDHTLLIKPGGSLWSWGANGSGQLGDGTTNGMPVAIRVGAATDWVAVACGDFFSFGIRGGGSLWAWGFNGGGQLGLGDTDVRTSPQRVGSDTDWVAVACGDDHVLALKSDGSLWAWGYNAYGQLGLGDTADVSTPTQVGAATDWDAISCGSDFSTALKDDGTLWVWGRNNRSQLGLGDTAVRLAPVQLGDDTDWASVHCGDEDARALTSSGTLWAWGYNFWGQLGLGDKAIRTEPTQIGTDSDWDEFACGDDHTAALKSDGSLWAWGDNNYGQLGQGDTTELTSPTQVGSATNWSRVLCGDDFTTALRPDDELWGFGDNQSGDLSLGDVTNRLSPTLLFITSDGTAPVIGSLTSSTHPDPAAWYPLADCEFSWAGADASGIAGYKSQMNEAATTVVSTGYPSTLTTRGVAGEADGLHYFHVRAVDRAGNWSATSTRAVRIDTTAPSIALLRPQEGATYAQGSTVTCAWTSDDVHSGIATDTARLDGSPIAGGAALDTDATGDHTFVVTATDEAGNQSVESVAYAVEALVFTITPTAGANGAITPATPQTVDSGADQVFAITPDTGYHVADVVVDGSSVGARTSYTFANVTADHTISASFAIDTFTITPTAGANGSITPATPQTVEYGQAKTFTIRPVSGYYIADVLVDGVSLGPLATHTFTAIAANHAISATFAPGVQTELWIGADKNVVNYGGSTVLRGELSYVPAGTTTPVGLGGRLVTVEQAPSSMGPWEYLDARTTSSLAGELGQLSLKVTPARPTYYRLRYVKEAFSEYGSAQSYFPKVGVRPLLGRPVVPTSVRAGRWFTLYGSLKPHFTAGEKTVKVKAYRYKNRRWVYVKTLSATNVDNGGFTKYRLRTRFTTRSKYRFRATTTAAGWAAATSIYSRLLVVR